MTKLKRTALFVLVGSAGGAAASWLYMSFGST